MGERPERCRALPGAAAEELRETAGILIAHNLSDLAHGQVGICQQPLRTLHPLPLNILSDGAAVSGVKGILLFEWKHLMVSKRNIENLIQEPEETGEDAPFAPERHDITFRDVSFSYVP